MSKQQKDLELPKFDWASISKQKSLDLVVSFLCI